MAVRYLGDNRNWLNSWPYNSWKQRLYEAAGIIRGRFSLHRAYQLGLDRGAASEYHRLIYNKAAVSELAEQEIRDHEMSQAGFTQS